MTRLEFENVNGIVPQLRINETEITSKAFIQFIDRQSSFQDRWRFFFNSQAFTVWHIAKFRRSVSCLMSYRRYRVLFIVNPALTARRHANNAVSLPIQARRMLFWAYPWDLHRRQLEGRRGEKGRYRRTRIVRWCAPLATTRWANPIASIPA